MNGHGSQVRPEWKLVTRTTLGTTVVDWSETEEAAETTRAKYAARGLEHVSLELTDRILDF